MISGTGSLKAALQLLMLFSEEGHRQEHRGPWAVRVSAARAILECGLHFTEALDLAEWVAALEEKRIADS